MAFDEAATGSGKARNETMRPRVIFLALDRRSDHIAELEAN
jgi:hypothetical protein